MKSKLLKLAEEGVTDEGHWAGEGNAASGILPIARDTKRICLAWRSIEVDTGDCWGTIGGAVKEDMSPAESAQEEMKEETGYHDSIEMHPAYVFQDGTFRYFNFIGVVDSEFDYNPGEDHGWETDYIEWMTLDEVKEQIKTNPSHFHPGLLTLFKQSKDLIEKLAGSDPLQKEAKLPPVEQDKVVIDTFLHNLRGELVAQPEASVQDDTLLNAIAAVSYHTVVGAIVGQEPAEEDQDSPALYVSGGHYEPHQHRIQLNFHPGCGRKVWAAAKENQDAWASFARAITVLLVHERTHLQQFRAVLFQAIEQDKPFAGKVKNVLNTYKVPVKHPGTEFYTTESRKEYLSHHLEIAANARMAMEQVRSRKFNWGSYDNKSLYTLLQNSGLWSSLANTSTAFDKYYSLFYAGWRQKSKEEQKQDAIVFRKFLQECVKALPPEDHKPRSREDMELANELDPPRFKESAALATNTIPSFEDFIKQYGQGDHGLWDGTQLENAAWDLSKDDPEYYDLSYKEIDARAEKELMQKLRERYSQLRSHYASFAYPLSLYREVLLPGGIETLRSKDIGIYWTPDITKAEAYLGEGYGNRFLLKAIAYEEDIDWPATLRANIDLSTGEAEDEVTLKRGVPLEAIGYRQVGGSSFRSRRTDRGGATWDWLEGKHLVASKTSMRNASDVTFPTYEQYCDSLGGEQAAIEQFRKAHFYMASTVGGPSEAERLRQHYDETVAKLTKINSNYRITIYRAITLPKGIRSLNTEKMGIYWTWDESKAQAYWGDEGDSARSSTQTYVFSARATRDEVDWAKTFENHMHPGQHGDFSEEEITLKQGASLLPEYYRRNGTDNWKEWNGPDGRVVRASKSGFDVTYDNDCHDSHGGETYCNVFARDSKGKTVGKINYGIYDNELHIKMVEVLPAYRRKGIGTGLMEKLRSSNPGMGINWGGLTPGGVAFKAKVHRPSDVPPNRLQAELEELRPQMAAEAQTTYDEWSLPEYGDDGLGSFIQTELSYLIRRETSGYANASVQQGDYVLEVESSRDDRARVVLPANIFEERHDLLWRVKPGVTFKPEDFIITGEPRDKAAASFDPDGDYAPRLAQEFRQKGLDVDLRETYHIIRVTTLRAPRTRAQLTHQFMEELTEYAEMVDKKILIAPGAQYDTVHSNGVSTMQVTAKKSVLLTAKQDGVSAELRALAEEFRQKGCDVWVTPRAGYILLDKIIVPEDKRSQGLGSQFMEKLTALADKFGLPIFLTPTKDFGANSIVRLREFYKRFGFVFNKGRNKDFRAQAAMVRQPKGATPEPPKGSHTASESESTKEWQQLPEDTSGQRTIKSILLTASPDFGYTSYVDREADLAEVTFDVVNNGKAFNIVAMYEKKEQGFIYIWTIDKVAVVGEVEMDKQWHGTGLGQMLYDRAISETKHRGFKVFLSDTPEKRSDAADRAWKRLAQRYPVTHNVEDDRFFIDLTKVGSKTASVYEGIDLLESDSSDLPPFEELVDDIPAYDRKSKDRRVLRGLYGQIAEMHTSGPLTVYRAVALAGGPDSVNTDSFGEFWSWDEAAAKAYYPEHAGAPVYIFQGKVSPQNVDWWETAKRHLCNDEREIRVIKGAGVELQGWRSEDDQEWHALKDGPKMVTAKAKLLTASPDFGYSRYNDREQDLNQVEIRIVEDDRGHGAYNACAYLPDAVDEYDDIGRVECYTDLDKDNQYTVGESSIFPEWRGTGLGQMLYDAAIAEAKRRGGKQFWSGRVLSPDARKAWARLEMRYPVHKEMSGRKVRRYWIDLQQATVKAASPDFGYTKFNDREQDLAKINWVTVPFRSPGFEIKAHFTDKYGTLESLGSIKCDYYPNGDAELKDGGVVYSSIVEINRYWKGTGLGQMLYDKAIAHAKKLGARWFCSDTSLSRAAVSGWQRLKKRYPVEEVLGAAHDSDVEEDEDDEAIPGYKIDLNKVTIPKAAGLPKNPPGKAENTTYEPETNGWALFPDQRGENVAPSIDELVPETMKRSKLLTASPDFGYTKFNDALENEIVAADFRIVPHPNGFIVEADIPSQRKAAYVGCTLHEGDCYVGTSGSVPMVRGTGLGQMTYDHAIAHAKELGCTTFRSDMTLSDAAIKAWGRLRHRYPVTVIPKGGKNSLTKKVIDTYSIDLAKIIAPV